MYAIETYFIAPTNTRGARIKARIMEGTRDGRPARSLTLAWDHAKNPRENHEDALGVLACKLGWDGAWVEGGGPDGSSVWVRSRAPYGGIADVWVGPEVAQ